MFRLSGAAALMHTRSAPSGSWRENSAAYPLAMTTSALALLALSLFALAGCESGSRKSDSRESAAAGPWLVRDSDGKSAVLVCYLRGETPEDPPPGAEEFIFAAWSDGYSLTRPKLIAAQLHSIQVEPALVKNAVDRIWRASRLVAPDDRVVEPSGEADFVHAVLEPNGEGQVLLVGWATTPGSQRERAITEWAVALESFLQLDGPTYAGEPRIRWTRLRE